MPIISARLRRWWHCLRGTLSGHRAETAWAPDYQTVFVGCSCGRVFYSYSEMLKRKAGLH